MPLRIALAVVAAALMGWLAVQLAEAWRLHDAADIAFQPGGPPGRAKVRRADDLLRGGGFAFDRQRRLTRAFLLTRAHRPEAAIGVLLALTREEPKNPDAWGLLGAVAARGHPGLAARARARERELVPAVSR